MDGHDSRTPPLRAPPEPEAQPGTNRLEAFSDGVFAIVITLLVLELHVPQIANAQDASELLRAVARLAPELLSFVMGFLFVAVFWVTHHQFFHHIHRSTVGLIWLNNLFLLALTFTPFPTALLGTYPQNTFAVVFFGASLVVTSLSFSLLRWYAMVRARLLGEHLEPAVVQAALRRSLIGPVIFGAAMLIALVSTTAAIALFLVVPLIYVVPIRLRHNVRQ